MKTTRDFARLHNDVQALSPAIKRKLASIDALERRVRVLEGDGADYVKRDGTTPLTGDWDNTGRRIRNTGVAEVTGTAPTSPAVGLIWLDESGSSGTAGIVTQRTITADYTATLADTVIWCDATAGPITLSLPVATTGGKVYWVKKVDASTNAVTIDGASADTLDGGLTATISWQYEALIAIADSTSDWRIH